MSEVWLQNMTWEDFQSRMTDSSGIVIVPVGSTEQHGRHLPLGSDTFVAMAIAEEAAKKTGAVVAPPLWYGWSPHHTVLPGTITIRPEILVELVYDVMQSLAAYECKSVILLNGHRIVNIAWLQIAAERAQRVLGLRVKIFDPAYMSRDIADELGFGQVGHAEEIESSHMWYCHPELYHVDKVLDYVPESSKFHKIDPRLAGDTLCYVPLTREGMRQSVDCGKGVSGSPSRASVEKGKAYHEHLVNRLTEVIELIRE